MPVSLPDVARNGAIVAGVAVGLWLGSKLLGYVRVQLQRKSILAKYREAMIPSREQLAELKADFIQQLKAGLSKDIDPNGRHMLMLPTFVTKMPTGHESGDVFAIDLGGTNFRVMHIVLSDEQSVVDSTKSTQVAIPEDIYTGTGTQLFDFLAKAIKNTVEAHSSALKDGKEPVVGFCFSFAMKQTALNSGTLLAWTKGFTCSGVEGEDPVRLLNEALVRVGCPCKVAVLLNDSVAVLAAKKYLEPRTSVGVIIGTGTNACYVESAPRLSKWKGGPSVGPDTETAVNIEWGAFWSPRLPRCEVDEDVDRASKHPGQYMFEKLLSGLYLGEVARRMLLRLCADTQLLGDYSTDMDAARVMATLAVPNSFTTAHLAQVAEDESPMLQVTAEILASALGATIRQAPASARRVVRDVCRLVTQRSAILIAMAIDGLLTHTGWVAANSSSSSSSSSTAEPPAGAEAGKKGTAGYTVVAFDGSVYEKFALYRYLLRQALDAQMGPQLSKQVKFELCHDGSCLGAAVLAAAAVK